MQGLKPLFLQNSIQAEIKNQTKKPNKMVCYYNMRLYQLNTHTNTQSYNEYKRACMSVLSATQFCRFYRLPPAVRYEPSNARVQIPVTALVVRARGRGHAPSRTPLQSFVHRLVHHEPIRRPLANSTPQLCSIPNTFKHILSLFEHIMCVCVGLFFKFNSLTRHHALWSYYS